jgi:hypothetical protein
MFLRCIYYCITALQLSLNNVNLSIFLFPIHFLNFISEFIFAFLGLNGLYYFSLNFILIWFRLTLFWVIAIDIWVKEIGIEIYRLLFGGNCFNFLGNCISRAAIKQCGISDASDVHHFVWIEGDIRHLQS